MGQGRAVQAVRVSLSGPVSDSYDVWYRVHAAGYGWLGWAKDGEAAGTEGLGVQAEALQVVLVEKGGDAPPVRRILTHSTALPWPVVPAAAPPETSSCQPTPETWAL